MAKHEGVGLQLNKLLAESEILQPNTSRHDLKSECREKGINTYHEQGSVTPITSYKTYSTYKSVYNDIGHFVRSPLVSEKIYNIKEITPQAVSEFLNHKIDNGCAMKTIVDGYAPALNKLDDIINRSGGSVDFSSAIADCVARAKDECPQTHLIERAYNNPDVVIDNIADGKCKLACEIMHDYGIRISSAKFIDLDKQLNGTELQINGKGGHIQTITLSENHANSLRNYAVNNKFNIPYNNVSSELKNACFTSNERFSGCHSFRHNYAQERMGELTAEGRDFYESAKIVSEEVGHHRMDITLEYLR